MSRLDVSLAGFAARPAWRTAGGVRILGVCMAAWTSLQVRSRDMETKMEIHRDMHLKPTAATPQQTIDPACDAWLDRTLEDTFPASDPLASYSFD